MKAKNNNDKGDGARRAASKKIALTRVFLELEKNIRESEALLRSMRNFAREATRIAMTEKNSEESQKARDGALEAARICAGEVRKPDVAPLRELLEHWNE